MHYLSRGVLPMKRAYLATLTITLLTATSAYAINCKTIPTCAELGYTDEVKNCSGDSIKCPFDLTVGKCVGSGATVGQIGYFPYTVNDSKWIKCDGRFLHKDAYPELYAVLKNTFGGWGSAFRVPDYAGDFVRVYGTDSYGVTTRQAEGLPNINGTLRVVTQDKEQVGAFTKASTWNTKIRGGGDSDTWGWQINFNASSFNPIYGASSHVTPVNTAVYAYIYAGKVDTSKGSAKNIPTDCAAGYYYYTDGTCSSTLNTSKAQRGIVRSVSKGTNYSSVSFIVGGSSTASTYASAQQYCRNNYNGLVNDVNAARVIPASATGKTYPITAGRAYWSSSALVYNCTGTTVSTCSTSTTLPSYAHYWCGGTDYYY